MHYFTQNILENIVKNVHDFKILYILFVYQHFNNYQIILLIALCFDMF